MAAMRSAHSPLRRFAMSALILGLLGKGPLAGESALHRVGIDRANMVNADALGPPNVHAAA